MIEQAKKYFPENVNGYQRTIATNYMHMGRYNDVLKICDEILAEDIDYESKRRTLNQKKTVYFVLFMRAQEQFKRGIIIYYRLFMN